MVGRTVRQTICRTSRADWCPFTLGRGLKDFKLQSMGKASHCLPVLERLVLNTIFLNALVTMSYGFVALNVGYISLIDARARTVGRAERADVWMDRPREM